MFDILETPRPKTKEVQASRLFEIKRQTLGNFLTETTQNLEEGIRDRTIAFVYQKGIGFIDGDNAKTCFLETSDFGGEKPFFGSCVAVISWGPSAKLTCILHVDTLTDITKAKQLMEERFSGERQLELSIVGGQDGASEGILQRINENFCTNRKWHLKRLDILGPKNSMTRQVVIDGQTGAVYDLQGDARKNMKPWGIKLPKEIKTRQAKTGLIERTVFVDVDIKPGLV